MNYNLRVTSHTWNKDSNLLYDYEALDYSSHDINVSQSGYLTKKEKKLSFKSKVDKSLHNEYIGSVTYKDDEFSLHVQDELDMVKNIDEKLWLVIKSTGYKDKNGHRLREEDLIKFGKVMFKVKEIRSDEKINKNKSIANLIKEKTACEINNNNVEMNIIQPIHINVNNNNNNARKANSICRICLMDDNESSNPLINPCHCMGSVRFIHLLCIRQWLNSKVTTKMFNFLTVHSFKTLECEICKTPFPERIKYRNEILYLVEYSKPETNYVMLESIAREKRETKYLYIIHMQEKNIIKLGRSNDSDVRMTDTSVSRNHALLKLINGDFYLEDNSSKFGTLVQMQNSLIIIPDRQVGIQSGKIFILFSLNKTCWAWLKCYENKKFRDLDYNDYLENKPPQLYLNELENIQVINTDFTISVDGMSNIKITQKIDENEDNFFYKQIEKDLKELKEELKEEMRELRSHHSVMIKEKDDKINHNQYLTINDDKTTPMNYNSNVVIGSSNSSTNQVNNHYIHLPNVSASISNLNLATTFGKDSMHLFPSHLEHDKILMRENKLELLNRNRNEYETNDTRVINNNHNFDSNYDISLIPKSIWNIPKSTKNVKNINKNDNNEKENIFINFNENENENNTQNLLFNSHTFTNFNKIINNDDISEEPEKEEIQFTNNLTNIYDNVDNNLDKITKIKMNYNNNCLNSSSIENHPKCIDSVIINERNYFSYDNNKRNEQNFIFEDNIININNTQSNNNVTQVENKSIKEIIEDDIINIYGDFIKHSENIEKDKNLIINNINLTENNFNIKILRKGRTMSEAEIKSDFKMKNSTENNLYPNSIITARKNSSSSFLSNKSEGNNLHSNRSVFNITDL